MRIIAAIIVLGVVFVAVLANARPTLAEPTWLQVGVARLADLIAEGCGPGLALEQPTRLELGSLRPRLAPDLSAAMSAFLAPEFQATGHRRS